MSGLSVEAVVGTGVAGLPAASVLSRGQDVVLYEGEDRLGGHAHPRQPPPPPARGGVGAPAGARRTYGLPGVGRHPRTPTGAPRSHPAAHHRLPSRTARPTAVRVSHDPDRPRRPAVAEPHPVTPHANGRGDEGTLLARTVHEQPVRPRPVPETREGLL
ncbi:MULTISPECIES: NAD(P)-binding protein [Streptomyces]|uniref:NAD(P)-binding protein n=1 Tax=Streptomyces TaxID=1883 RepID=UPI00017F14CD